ncbi:MAG: ABC transporter permease [Clostridiales bacterium]|nr:ABC transporter permease [Clostridiales bacterium]
MSFLWISLKNALRAQAGSWRTWLLLLLLPALTFGARLALPAEEAATPVQVGVVLPARGGEELWNRLDERGGLVVTFCRSDGDQAERQVAAGRWDCALVLPEDFEERLARRDTDELFTLLVGPGSTVYPMVRETVTACVAELTAPGVAEDYLVDSGILDREGAAQARPRLEETLLEQERVLVSMETVDGRPLDPITLADSGVDGLLAGLIAIVLSVWALFAAMDLGRWLDSPFARRLRPLRGTTALLLPRMAGALLPALCSGALALLALERPWACLLPLTAYLMFWGALALLLARCGAVWSALPAAVPFVPVLALLLSPVLIDLSLLFPALAPAVRWSPVSLFLRSCGGSWGDGLLLAAVGAVIPAALWTAERCAKRKNFG